MSRTNRTAGASPPCHPVASPRVSQAPVSTRLHLVRHCDVRNPEGVLYGHLPDFPLSEKGVKQAHALGRYLAHSSARQIYSSPLERARQTSEIIASYLDSVPITYTDDLIETRFGLYLQGVPPKQVPWRRPLWLVHMILPGLLANDESVPALASRVRRPLMRLLADHHGDGGICVSHGDPIQGFWVAAEHRPRYALHRLQCAKGGLLQLDYEGEELRHLNYLSPAGIAELAPGPDQTEAVSRSGA
jgi:broad specificity phosphatase PhoE